METNILGIQIPFSSAVSFGEISDSGRRRNSKSKFKTLSRTLYHFFTSMVIESFGVHPRLRLGHFRYGYSRLDANVRASKKPNGSNTSK
jgi:hypothetical protein